VIYGSVPTATLKRSSATIVGVGASRIAEHYEADFATAVRQTGGDQLQVNDC
jgi:hypothetical protein